ncbi:MAG TPA: hypothetical protein VH370_12720 [Humisphaera sp.]|jgi:hypothetical protein|nr:hypothetical protein [Humisphaera sp.]
MRTILFLFASLVLGGCSTTQSFDVSVKNEGARPVTIALTKTGGPVEDQWASPEQIADRKSEVSAKHGIVLVAPGKTAHVSDLKAELPSNAHAVLRVYPGDPNYLDMLKMQPGHGRVDMTLTPGANSFVIHETTTGLTIDRVASSK